MSWDKTYSVANDTLNGAAVEDVLMDKVDESIITTPIISIGVTNDVLTYTFKSEPTAGELTVLDLITNNHDGVPYSEAPERVEISKEPSFTSKKVMVNGVEKSLFKRVHGVRSPVIPANTTGYFELVIPYPMSKFTGAELFGVDRLDTLDFFILDNDTNSYSGLPLDPYGPNFPLNQFGFDVEMPGETLEAIYNTEDPPAIIGYRNHGNGNYANTSNYDADLFQSMIVMCAYKNNSPVDKIISGNFWLHEVR